MNLKHRLEGVVPEAILPDIPTSYEVIGDIAVITIPPSCEPYRESIGLAIISQRRNVRTVLSRSPIPLGEERVPRFETIIGSSTTTIYREFGFMYQLDLSKVFFNPRLAAERHRVLSSVQCDEEILVPFAGIGPFVIPAAARGARVTAIEKNPWAVQWLKGNIGLNRVEGRVTVEEGDAMIIMKDRSTIYDRAICPTPYGRDSVLPLVAGKVRPCGIVHFYTFCNDRQAHDLAVAFADGGLEVFFSRNCGQVAPGISRYVFDLRKGGTIDS